MKHFKLDKPSAKESVMIKELLVADRGSQDDSNHSSVVSYSSDLKRLLE